MMSYPEFVGKAVRGSILPSSYHLRPERDGGKLGVYTYAREGYEVHVHFDETTNQVDAAHALLAGDAGRSKGERQGPDYPLDNFQAAMIARAVEANAHMYHASASGGGSGGGGGESGGGGGGFGGGGGGSGSNTGSC